MIIRRSNNNALHCDSGLPAVDLPNLKQWFVEGKLHRSDGPAVVSGTGRMYFWRGIYISSKMWEECPTYAGADILGIANLELRRAVLEKVGYDKFLDVAKVVDEGQGDFAECVLYSMKITDEQPPDDVVKFVKLKNSSPEPDGTYKNYFLRVPPDKTTVASAVKWSFGFGDKDKMSYVVQT